MIEVDTATFVVGLVMGALPSAPIIANLITEKRSHAATQRQHALEIERRAHAEAQSQAQGLTRQLTCSHHESDQVVIQSLRQDNQRLQGETSAQAVTICRAEPPK